MSSPQRRAMQFMPNSPSPPRGTICNFPDGIEVLMLAQARSELGLRSWFAEAQKGNVVLEKHRDPIPHRSKCHAERSKAPARRSRKPALSEAEGDPV